MSFYNKLYYFTINFLFIFLPKFVLPQFFMFLLNVQFRDISCFIAKIAIISVYCIIRSRIIYEII